jgi:hypothetical protein
LAAAYEGSQIYDNASEEDGSTAELQVHRYRHERSHAVDQCGIRDELGGLHWGDVQVLGKDGDVDCWSE